MIYNGLQIRVNPYMELKTKWVFPKDRFVEWGPEDESYCRMAGYGHAEIIHEVFRIGDAVYMRPETFEDLKKEINQKASRDMGRFAPSLSNQGIVATTCCW